MALYYELPETDGPPSFSRLGLGSLNKSNDASEFSMNLDDICTTMERAKSRDFSSFSLSCWEEDSDEDVHEERCGKGSSSSSPAMSKYIDMGSSRLEALDNGKRNDNSRVFDYYGARHGRGVDDDDEEEHGIETAKKMKRKVHFDLEPEVHVIERVELEDYPVLYYCVHELQKMAEEFQNEENGRRRIIR